jgi:D-arabinose 1-dehydrogenase-like Zn-dependent alcohol dehydrogenase
VGQRVGVGWHGGHCGYCDSCRRGDFVTCSKGRQITGLTCDGGYAEYMVISAAALAAIPDAISATDAGPLSTGTLACAGFAGVNKSAQAGVPVLHDFFRGLFSLWGLVLPWTNPRRQDRWRKTPIPNPLSF